MTHPSPNLKTDPDRRSWLRKMGGVSALAASALMLADMIILIVSLLRPETINAGLAFIRDNWLVKIFILHAGFGGIHADLQGLNLLDIFFLLLVGLICLGISTIFRNARRVWSLIALGLSAAGIVLFLVTQIAGRSTVMLVVLIISGVVFRDKTFRAAALYTGIPAGVFLFLGDLTVGVQSNIITTLFGIGYLLLIAWFILIARGLLQPGYKTRN